MCPVWPPISGAPRLLSLPEEGCVWLESPECIWGAHTQRHAPHKAVPPALQQLKRPHGWACDRGGYSEEVQGMPPGSCNVEIRGVPMGLEA